MNRYLLSGIGVAVCAAAVFAGCSGGGGSGSTTPPVAQTAQPKATSTPTQTATAKSASVSFHFLLPFQRSASVDRSAKYISPSTQSVIVKLLTVDGVAPSPIPSSTINIGATQPGCTPSGVQVSCDLSVQIPLGVDTFSVTAYDALGGTGNIVGTATVPQTVYANAANRVVLTLSGTIASLFLFSPQFPFCSGECSSSPRLYSPTVSTPTQALIVPIPLDSAGNQIVLPGTYFLPITFSVTPQGAAPLGGLLFILNGGTPASTAVAVGPTDQVFVVAQSIVGSGYYNINADYGGGAAHLYVNLIGVAPSPTPTPTPSPTPSPSPTPYPLSVTAPNLVNGTLTFFAHSSAQVVSISDVSFPAAIGYSLNSCSPNATNLVSILPSPGSSPSPSGTVTSGGTLTLTPTTSTTVFGSCTLTITDSNANKQFITINLYSVTGTIQ